MKHIKLYENWKRNSDDATIKEVADTIDDILLDISDMGFPYVHDAMIFREKIMFEITATSDGMLAPEGVSNSDAPTFKITNEILSVLERCNQYADQMGYNINIHLARAIGNFGKEFDSVDKLKGYISEGYNTVVNFIGVTIKKNKSNEIS